MPDTRTAIFSSGDRSSLEETQRALADMSRLDAQSARLWDAPEPEPCHDGQRRRAVSKDSRSFFSSRKTAWLLLVVVLDHTDKPPAGLQGNYYGDAPSRAVHRGAGYLAYHRGIRWIFRRPCFSRVCDDGFPYIAM